MSSYTLMYVFLGIIGVFVLGYYLKRQYLIRGTIFSCFSGLLCLTITNLVTTYLGVALPITTFTSCVSLALGIPGVITLMMLRLIVGI